MVPSEVKLKIDYVNDDYRKIILRRATRMIGGQLVISFLSLFVLYVVASHFITENLPQGFRIFAAVFIFAFPVLQTGWWFRHYLNLLKNANSKYNGENLVFSENGVSQIGNRRTAKYEWSRYSAAAEYPDSFMLLPNPDNSEKNVLLIPKRWFESEEQIGMFKDIVEKCLVKKKGERSPQIDN